MDSPGPSRPARRPSRLRRAARWIVGLIVVAFVVLNVLAVYGHLAFAHRAAAMDRRMRTIGGGFTSGRRDASRRVTAWAYGRSVGDEQMEFVAAVLRDWQEGGGGDGLSLDLAGSNVGDAGLIPLHRVPALDAIDLSKTKVTAAGIEGLRIARPRLRIRWDADSAGPQIP